MAYKTEEKARRKVRGTSILDEDPTSRHLNSTPTPANLNARRDLTVLLEKLANKYRRLLSRCARERRFFCEYSSQTKADSVRQETVSERVIYAHLRTCEVRCIRISPGCNP